MALRQIDIYLPADTTAFPDVEELQQKYKVIDYRLLRDQGENPVARLLLDSKNSQALLDRMIEELEEDGGYRIIVTKVAATLPRLKKEEEEKEEPPGTTRTGRVPKPMDAEEEVSRISREEVFEEVKNSISVSNTHYTLVFLSTVVAAAGMLRDSTTIVIGAMVIAPLIGPNIALALGTTLADFQLLRRAMKVNFLGLLVVLVVSLVAGLILPVEITVSEIADRTVINSGDVALALAAGAAGVLSVTRGVSTALIGVMVAVALLPPLTAVGLLLGNGEFGAAYGAALLTVINLVALNLAGVLTFLFQGIRPTTWYEAKKAKKSTALAIVLWVAILATLIAVLTLAGPEGL